MKTKDFVWCREEIMRDCEKFFPKAHAHIAIRSPESNQQPPKCGNPTIRLAFYDLDPAAIARTEAYSKNSARGDELIDGCFKERHAEEIITFVEKVNRELIVVNCEAGVSRSPGVVLALRRHYGGDVDEPFQKAVPNIHVVSVLGQAFRGRSRKET